MDHLSKFYAVLDLDNVKHLAGWCAMLLAFFGFFRASNLVPPSQPSFDPLKHFKRDDIRFCDNTVLVFFKWSKTNQNTSKVSWIPIIPVSDPRFNLKVHLKKLFSVTRASKDAPLFSFGKEKFHTKYTLVKLLDSVVSKVELDPADYSWHSFRRGAAVFAYELCLSDSVVQLLGDWSSSAFKNYLEFSFLKKISVAEDISKNFDICVKKCI